MKFGSFSRPSLSHQAWTLLCPRKISQFLSRASSGFLQPLDFSLCGSAYVSSSAKSRRPPVPPPAAVLVTSPRSIALTPSPCLLPPSAPTGTIGLKAPLGSLDLQGSTTFGSVSIVRPHGIIEGFSSMAPSSLPRHRHGPPSGLHSGFPSDSSCSRLHPGPSCHLCPPGLSICHLPWFPAFHLLCVLFQSPHPPFSVGLLRREDAPFWEGGIFV